MKEIWLLEFLKLLEMVDSPMGDLFITNGGCQK